jgi:hypothetical protein
MDYVFLESVDDLTEPFFIKFKVVNISTHEAIERHLHDKVMLT